MRIFVSYWTGVILIATAIAMKYGTVDAIMVMGIAAVVQTIVLIDRK